MPASPLVSVVMCTYNGGAYLKEQVDTLLAQRYEALEFIFVDDRSQDDTYAILQDYAAKDDRIQLYQNEQNLGYNRNYEKAFSYCNGAFIAIADQDDTWHHDKISTMMERGWDEADTLLIHSRSAMFRSGHPIDLQSAYTRKPFEGRDVRQFFLFNHISGHNMIFRRSLTEHLLPLPSHVYYDWWLGVVACCYGRIGFVDDVLVFHRIHEKNASGFRDVFRPFYEYVLDYLPEYLAIPAMPAEAKRLGEQLLQLFGTLRYRRFSPALFLLILRYAPVFFAFKRKRFPYLSYVKHAYRLATATFLRKAH